MALQQRRRPPGGPVLSEKRLQPTGCGGAGVRLRGGNIFTTVATILGPRPVGITRFTACQPASQINFIHPIERKARWRGVLRLKVLPAGSVLWQKGASGY